MTQLLVRKCSKGTGFSKLWLLRDLEILSIMLYSSKREINSMAQDPERDQREPDKEHDSDHSSYAEDTDINKADPLEGLDEETKICFQVTIFSQSLFSGFDGNEIKTDEIIRTLAQKWQPSKRPHSEERNAKAVDTDMIVVSCVVSFKHLHPLGMSPIGVVWCVSHLCHPPPQSKPSHCEKATEEINVVAQKLITNSESDLQLSYSKQRRTKSSALLHKELDVRGNRTVRQYLVKVNEAIATLYARHVLALLLADWPAEMPLSDEALELSGASHMAYILDMLMQLEEKQHWEKVDILSVHVQLSLYETSHVE